MMATMRRRSLFHCTVHIGMPCIGLPPSMLRSTIFNVYVDNNDNNRNDDNNARMTKKNAGGGSRRHSKPAPVTTTTATATKAVLTVSLMVYGLLALRNVPDADAFTFVSNAEWHRSPTVAASLSSSSSATTTRETPTYFHRPFPLRTTQRFARETAVFAAEDEDDLEGSVGVAEEDDDCRVDDGTSAGLGFSLGCKEAHAREVFRRVVAASNAEVLELDEEADVNTAVASEEQLEQVLQCLDIEANLEDATILFRYLDADENGKVEFEEFLPWYEQAVYAADEVGASFQELIIGRRTIEEFDRTPVSDDILRRAVLCAIAAPNRSMSEPWRFIKVGPETVQKFADLNTKIRKNMESETGSESVVDWTEIPGWCVVTNKVTKDNPDIELEDYKSTSCAIQNFMLSMWSEGVGTKWTSGPVQRTREFADLCGVDVDKEKVVGCIWYGFASGGTKYADPRRRRKTVDDVLRTLP